MSASKNLAHYLKSALIPELKKLGFTAKGRVLKRQNGDAVQIIEFLNWKYNDAEKAQFTVEIGVCFPGILDEVANFEEFSYYRPYVDNPDVAVCFQRERLGMFMKPPQDYWWPVGKAADDMPNPAEILGLITHSALPWLDAWSSLDYFVHHGKADTGQLGIVARAACGYRDEAIAAAQNFAKLRHQQNAQAERELFAELVKLVDAVQTRYGK